MRRATAVEVFLLLIALSSAAEAAGKDGWGFGLLYAAGDFDYTSKKYLMPEREASGGMHGFGAAFVYDSANIKNSRFNCRLGFELERAVIDSDDGSVSEPVCSFKTGVLPGLGLIQSPFLRLWAGPELLIGMAQGGGGGFARYASSLVTGIGGAAGVTINVYRNHDISLSAGIRKEFLSAGGNGLNTTLKGDAKYVYFAAAVILREKE